MLETIMNKKYEMLNFQPFIEYVKKLEQENFTLLSDKEETSTDRNLIFQNEEEFLKISIFTDSEKEWISFLKFKEEHYNYVQTEFLLYNEKGIKFYEPTYNRVIKFAAYSFEGDYAKLITAAFGYHDNQYEINSGWRHTRKIEKEELNKIITCSMNLQELIMRAEKLNLKFYEQIDEKDGEVRKLKLSYDE